MEQNNVDLARQGVREALDALGRGDIDVRATFEHVVFEVEQVLPAGGRVLVVVSQRTRGRAGGVETNLRWGILLSVRDGLIVRAENYYDVDHALEAAGLANGGAMTEGGAR